MRRAAPFDELYVEARRVLLDALDGLASHLSAIVLVGAQAIYLRTGDALRGLAPYTTDSDLVLAPALLGDEPALEQAMGGAGFRLQLLGDHVEPGIWLQSGTVAGERVDIPVDLIVPDGAAPPGGHRGARLGPVHGRRAARRILGLEAALVDNGPMTVAALDEADGRRHAIAVAGPAALLVAKAHKLGERVTGGQEHRLVDKDAADVVRLFSSSRPATVGETLSRLRDDPLAGTSVETGRRYLEMLFGRRGAPGVVMASRALRLALPAESVEAICFRYMADLRALG